MRGWAESIDMAVYQWMVTGSYVVLFSGVSDVLRCRIHLGHIAAMEEVALANFYENTRDSG
jgi:hypothetical protein